MHIQLAQLNFTIGDLDVNCKKIIDFYSSHQNSSDLVIFSELAISGYPPEDLLLKGYFLDKIEDKIKLLADHTKSKKAAILIGSPVRIFDKYGSTSLFNSAILIENGFIKELFHKKELPNHGVFDEKRYFTASNNLKNIKFRGLNVAVLICEDIWNLKNSFLLLEQEIDLIISINSSPFEYNKLLTRIDRVKKFNQNLQKNIIYLNQVGGNDSLIFDGSSFVINKDNELALSLKEFEEDSALIEIDDYSDINSIGKFFMSEEQRVYSALTLGLRDYVYKNGFQNVVIGLSGGIDSALVATIAADALGPKNVRLIALPSKYNSSQSFIDAKNLSDNLSINLEQIPIQDIFNEVESSLQSIFGGKDADFTEENVQSRIRGLLLMAVSNKFGNLLLSTGNKSELATGYSTLYGDMNGAYNPIKDIYKTELYKLSKWRNKNIPRISKLQKDSIIPENIIIKDPTAELRESQKDSDSLPDYNILDQILYLIIEEQMSEEQVISKNFNPEIVKKVVKLFYNNEFKRRQSVIGPKISKMSFDGDRRYQITNRFKN
ncbi:MAG: NAD+ synthase [Ulvibacter sp.]|jgi:NAD+ synthase